MNRYIKWLLLVGCSALVIVLFLTGCNTTGSSSPPINIEPCRDDPEGNITFENVIVTRGILKDDYIATWSERYKAGEACYIITGRIKNNSSSDWWVVYRAHGYDKTGNAVSGTLDMIPIAGIAQSFIAAGGSLDFSLHLSWSEDAAKFILQSEKRKAKISGPFS
jgi:hypothetical protein